MNRTFKITLLICLLLLASIFTLTACKKDKHSNNNPAPTPTHTHTVVTDEAVSPTCTTSGKTQGSHCSTCGEITVAQEFIKPFGHTEVVDGAVASTCIVTGLTEGKHCSVCNQILVAQIETAKTNHSYDNEDDEECNKCGFVRETGCPHAETEIINGKSATCTDTGLTDGEKCSKCGMILVRQVTIDMLNHDYQDGVCTVCKAFDVEYLDAEKEAEYERHEQELEDIDEYYTSVISGLQENIDNTKDAYGISYVYSDSYCYDKISDLDYEIRNLERKIMSLSGSTNSSDVAERRRYEAQLSEKEAELEVLYKHISINHFYASIESYQGYWSDDIREENSLHQANIAKINSKYECAANGHTVVVDEAREPTCTTNGRTEGKYCSVCDETFVALEIIQSLGHTVVIDEAVASTCTVAGLTEGSHCSACGEILVKQEIINAGHTEIVDEAIAPTCTKTGLTEGSHCSACGEILIEQEIVDARHTEVLDKAVAPTCTQTGLTEGRHCASCGKTLIAQEIIQSLGHAEVVDKAIAPTCTEIGLTEGKHCAVCGEILIKQEVINPRHAEVIDKAVAPACTKTGITEGKHCSVCGNVIIAQEIIPALGHSFVNGYCIICDSETPYTREGDYIYFGEYPQSVKTNDVTITDTQDVRGYYLGSDGFYYAKVTATPRGSNYTFSTGDAVTSGTMYYFKVEPIRWRILSETNGKALILCDSIIAAMAYQPDIYSDSDNYYTTANGAPDNTYANNYKYSEVRKWLNQTFYETAFTEFQREIILTTMVDNSVESTGYSPNPCVCEDTEDKVFLISQAEVTNSAYGFSSNLFSPNSARRMETSDFSLATGSYMYDRNGIWWTRSPIKYNDGECRFTCRIECDGMATSSLNVSLSAGIVPAIWIDF